MADDIVTRANIPDFRRALAALGDRAEGKIVTRGLRSAGRVFRDEARRRAPVLDRPIVTRRKMRVPGTLRAAIYTGRSRASRKAAPVHFVGVRASKAQLRKGRDPFYWRFLEGGWIPRGPGRKLRGGNRSRRLHRDRLLKAGGRKVSYPFLQPTFAAVGSRALDAFNATVAAGIAEENARPR